jgi:hypothetical protein
LTATENSSDTATIMSQAGTENVAGPAIDVSNCDGLVFMLERSEDTIGQMGANIEIGLYNISRDRQNGRFV